MNPLLAWRVWRYKRAVLALWKEGKRGKWLSEGLSEREIRYRLRPHKTRFFKLLLKREKYVSKG